ncbi:hypothetical protein DPMN_100388 [Dreissena polymorpha]|uniref:Uncharacterized protein n=1 Tax=Dreissena polymorpha TaxID=45954 RepID=A0A9D4R864_DREPO|nr:hypothetical protein DPMN_100388 [Dreissena polymorpha]
MNNKGMAQTSLFRPPADIRQSNNQFFPLENLVNNKLVTKAPERPHFAHMRYKGTYLFCVPICVAHDVIRTDNLTNFHKE